MLQKWKYATVLRAETEGMADFMCIFFLECNANCCLMRIPCIPCIPWILIISHPKHGASWFREFPATLQSFPAFSEYIQTVHRQFGLRVFPAYLE